MDDKILARNILEGLVHNLNNHLNLILGYAQRLSNSHPELKETKIIYAAGIEIDKTLKDLAHHLEGISFAFEQDICLNDWLDKELEYLQHSLSIKHKIVFTRQDQVKGQNLSISPLHLALWYESKLLRLSSYADRLQIQTGVCEHDGKPCLYLLPQLELKPGQIKDLCKSPESELLPMKPFPIKSLWNYEGKSIMGIRI
ncbi:MAG: hypothetical protein RBR69_03370 [Candidatus Cloacimonadaceae bacterium]|jgi:hypothetical protein|nr:hypothetical protein [Candidatus Cloacimonadota bacterium]MDY0127157.1 hypothetical protein [Candidatus Cloacimonadaceae bacterium]MCB5255165.1 hypothetical protein [Candidatus Cloacimonadota bacterium]MCK9177638.1 hypothetical protein [Candidatus Cloacimonadota bacterium]MCK9242260.1 hypothetical protein [Candidatus Cloacimonadota bacterium]